MAVSAEGQYAYIYACRLCAFVSACFCIQECVYAALLLLYWLYCILVITVFECLTLFILSMFNSNNSQVVFYGYIRPE